MNSVIPGGIPFTVEKKDKWTTVYNMSINGHFVEFVVVKFKGTDYSMTVDCNTIFEAWSERFAAPKILETLKGL